jgi:hypothetical protein
MQFYFRVRVILEGVTITVDAESREEAEEKARAGNWADMDTGTAELTDWSSLRFAGHE